MTTLAEQECRRLGWAFTESFRNQYNIIDASRDGPEGWPSVVLGDWRVSYCQNLPMTELTLSNGTVAGIVLGYAISPDGLVLEGRHKLSISARSTTAVTQAEKYIAELAGRYVVLLSIGKTARVYSDPACSLGPVYNPKKRTLGASTALVLDRPVIENPEISADSVAAEEARYLFGQTVDRDVKRSISNHFIDLSDFSVHRHWPTQDTSFDMGKRPRQEVSNEIAEKLRLNMRALIERFPTALPVTGGTDSRLLLAAASDQLDKISQFFVYHTNWPNSLDTEVALEIAQEMSFPLRVISRDSHRFKTNVTRKQHGQHMQTRFLRGGFEPDSSEKGSIRAMQLVPKDLLILRGNVAEMSRALRWKRTVFDDPHNTEFALKKLAVPNTPSSEFYKWATASLLAWKETLPEKAVPRLYDFLHTELWLPHTNSAVYTREAEHFFINPYNDRHIIHLTSMMPPFMRKNRRLVNDIVFKYAKEISRFDYSTERGAKKREARETLMRA